MENVPLVAAMQETRAEVEEVVVENLGVEQETVEQDSEAVVIIFEIPYRHLPYHTIIQTFSLFE